MLGICYNISFYFDSLLLQIVDIDLIFSVERHNFYKQWNHEVFIPLNIWHICFLSWFMRRPQCHGFIAFYTRNDYNCKGSPLNIMGGYIFSLCKKSVVIYQRRTTLFRIIFGYLKHPFLKFIRNAVYNVRFHRLSLFTLETLTTATQALTLKPRKLT